MQMKPEGEKVSFEDFFPMWQERTGYVLDIRDFHREMSRR